MTKKDTPKGVNPEQVFLHKGFVLMHLKDAWLSLEAIEKLCSKCTAQTTVVPALIRDAVIQYGSAFKQSNVGERQTRKLDSSIVPDQYRDLHELIITYRDKVFAHIDIEPRNPKGTMQGEQVCYSVADMRPRMSHRAEPETALLPLEHYKLHGLNAYHLGNGPRATQKSAPISVILPLCRD